MERIHSAVFDWGRISFRIPTTATACVLKYVVFVQHAWSIRSALVVAASLVLINSHLLPPAFSRSNKLSLHNFLTLLLHLIIVINCTLFICRAFAAQPFVNFTTSRSCQHIAYHDQARDYQRRVLPLALCALNRCRCHLSAAIPRHDRVDFMAHVQD